MNACKKVTKLRSILQKCGVQAFIIPSEDAHQSEYIANYFERRHFISNFTGSAGSAIVTLNECALWTDGRYYLQAEKQLNEHWKLMKVGLKETPTQEEWLAKVLPPNSKIGVDPFLIKYSVFEKMSSTLDNKGHQLVCLHENPVDQVWDETGERISLPTDEIFIQPIEYSGMGIKEKVELVRAELKKKEIDLMVLSELDQIAWMFNVRGNDVVYNPVFYSYAKISQEEVILYINQSKVNATVKQHLEGVIVKPYLDIVEDLKEESQNQKKVWFSDKCSYGLASSFSKKLCTFETTLVEVLKASKNEVELQGMKNCHVRDGAALCMYFSWLEDELAKGTVIDEVDGSDKLESFRRRQKDFISLSFTTISSAGANAAVIHYSPEKGSCKRITRDEIYLCDSGAQYRDGTTDVTRTSHFGTPTDHEKFCFTQVLKGQMNLDFAVFPQGTPGRNLDVLARAPLWSCGLDYRHGTGHGVGSFLNVHEGPIGITFRTGQGYLGLQKNMILSNEPGYYEDGNFGIRIENLITVVPATTKHNFGDVGYLTFETLTMAPIQKKLIDVSLLTDRERNCLNAYHQMVWDKVSPILREQNEKSTEEWLKANTSPL